MFRRPALRRLIAALLGVALVWAPLAPVAIAAAATDDGLPAALAFVCAPLGADEDGGSAPAAGDHQTCGHCTGPCHGMAFALAASPVLPVPPAVTAFGAAAYGDGGPAAAVPAYDSRAPPLA